MAKFAVIGGTLYWRCRVEVHPHVMLQRKKD